ncbi:MAG: SNF2-related protein, partial [Myxococcota bacterium]
LELERLEVDADGTEVRLELPVRQAASRPGRELSLNEVDLDIDPLLQRGVTLIDRREQAKLLFERLEASSAVELEGVPVSINPNPYLPKGRILTRGDRYILRIESDATEVVAPDTVLVGSELRLLGETGLTGSRLEKLPIEKVYRRSELAVLTQEVLPIFDKRFPIEGKELLPRGRGKGRPRLELEVAMSDYAVSVTGSVVYGDPPSVRIVEGRPEYLGGVAPERDFEAEHRLVEKLRSELNLVPGRTTTVRGGEGAAFLEKVRRFEATSGRGLDLDDLPVLNPRLEMEGEGGFGLHLEAETEEGAVAADLRSALAAFETQQSLVPLLGGGWARLDQTWWTEHADAVALLLQLRDRDGQVPPLALPALGALAASLDAPPPPGLERLAPLFQDFSGLPEAPLPSDLEAELRPYQTEGHRWLAFLKSTGLGGLLADDMGLGKTLQTLTVLEARSLVVCPTSVLGNWAKELARFRPGLRAHVHHGPDRVMDEGADVVITTYALLRSDREILGAERWRVVVLDEAQAIKNPESLTARAAYGIEADFRLALTGTPVENRLSELWSQMHFVNPGLLGGRADFDSRFSDRIEAGDEVAQAKLRSRIKPFVLRRLKSEVARDLPPRTDMVL